MSLPRIWGTEAGLSTWSTCVGRVPYGHGYALVHADFGDKSDGQSFPLLFVRKPRPVGEDADAGIDWLLAVGADGMPDGYTILGKRTAGEGPPEWPFIVVPPAEPPVRRGFRTPHAALDYARRHASRGRRRRSP